MESVGDGFTWRRQNSSVDIDEDTLNGEPAPISPPHVQADATDAQKCTMAWASNEASAVQTARRAASAAAIPRVEMGDAHVQERGLAFYRGRGSSRDVLERGLASHRGRGSQKDIVNERQVRNGRVRI